MLSSYSRLRAQFGVALLVITSAAGVLVLAPRTLVAERGEPIVPVPLAGNGDRRRIVLGEKLFSDVRLSQSKEYSCLTCHPLDHGGMDAMPVAKSPTGGPDLRNTLTVFNVGLNSSYNWDGAADSLERHTELVVTSRALMNITWAELLARIGADNGYRSQFKAAYRDGLTRSNVVNAIAEFERSLLTPGCRFDRYLRGNGEALSAPEKEGYRLFKAYGCVSCHQGVNIGGNLYQKFGVFKEMLPRQNHADDPGRFRITRAPRDKHVFRVPSLRNVAVTGPYFHDGREPVLEKAVDTMAKAQLGRKLSDDEISDIVAFLKTLTGEYRGRLLTGPAKGVQ